MAAQADRSAWSRRELLAAGCTMAGALVLRPSAMADDAGSKNPDGPYSPFKMGLQSYSLRGFKREGHADLKKALEVTKELGLHFWESYTAHIPMQANTRALEPLKREIHAAGVSVVGYGVVHLSKDVDATRRIFDFAKAMELEYLSIDPDPAALDGIDRLLEAYDVALGIHNHGPGHRFAKIQTIAETIANHHPRLGCCIDTGHFLRSREDPVHAVEAFGKRVFGVHLKDVKDAKTFTILGKGDLRTVDFLKALARNKYSYCLAIEYEENEENPADDIKECLAEARKAIAEARKA